MKKVLFLISFLFAVVCYAAPPPDVGFVPDSYDEISLLQVVASDVPVYFEQGIEVQEVACVYLGNMEINMMNAYATIKEQPRLPVKFSNNSFGDLGLNGPPLYNNIYSGVINNGSGFEMDKQNSNYGYPRTAG